MIIALGKYTWSDYVGCDMLLSPLESIHDRTMSGITGYHCPWKSQTIVRCRAWHARIALGRHTWLDDVRNGMPLSPLYNIHGGTRSCLLCHHRHWEALALRQHSRWDDFGEVWHHRTWTTYTVGEHKVRHSILALGQNTRSKTSGVEGHHLS